MTTTAAEAQTARELFSQMRAIPGAQAVRDEGLVTIGGIKQWLSVRGRDRENPIILFLHGGPGFTVSPVSYYYMRDWEEYFTVAHWDQRGAGKTYAANDPATMRPTMTVEQMVRDAEEVAEHLRKTYGKRKIVLMAHSFGTILGVHLAQRRPDLFHAYVGMGQFVDFAQSEAMGYGATLAAARAQNMDNAVRELEAIAPFPDAERPERNLQNLGTERKWLAHFGGYYKGGGFGHNIALSAASPDYTEDELRLRDEAQGFSAGAMWAELGTVNFWRNTRFSLPVVVLMGKHDLGTSAELAGKWYETIKAPRKKLVWFEDSAHMVHEEEPGKLLVTLVNEVLPIVRDDSR